MIPSKQLFDFPFFIYNFVGTGLASKTFGASDPFAKSKGPEAISGFPAGLLIFFTLCDEKSRRVHNLHFPCALCDWM